tara:strand:+ start:377 stop:682 length:306 start_codon:yes stop_codon:yes gene_type:complete
MAKESAIQKNQKRRRLVKKYSEQRKELKSVIQDRSLPPEDRFMAQLRLAELPRNSSPTRVRNRCRVTGRPRGFYRKFGISRIAMRDLGSVGALPGLVKSSW